MDPARKKLIDRIVKLFKLGEEGRNNSEAEMMLAVSKARQLMAEHAISITDIADLKGDTAAQRADARIRDVPVFTRAGRTLADYDWWVAAAVATLTDTECLKRLSGGLNKRGNPSSLISVLFVGDEDDVALAGELFHLWLTDVRRMARQKYGGGNAWSLSHTSYAVGVAKRLGDRARTMVQLATADQQVWGLVVSSKRSAITRWKERAQVNTDPGRQRKRQWDADAYFSGYRDGESVSMTTKIVK